MSNTSNSSGVPKIVPIGLGIVLIAVGVFLNQTIHLDPETAGNIKVIGIDFQPGKTLGSIGMFLVLFPVIQSFFIAPLATAIEERNSNLENTFSEVESMRSEMSAMKSDYEKKLATTEADAREKINAQIKEAQALRQSLMAEAASKSDALIKQAQEEIAGEKSKALRDIQVHVTDLALAAAEKVVGKNMDSDTNRKLVADFIKDLEVAK
ncbi:MAG: F0F1 ATP synthase subunit B [Armatimonadota bacterium]